MHELPGVCRWMIGLASWLLPAAKRRAWRDHREFEVWNWWKLLAERGELTPTRRREVYRYCLGAFPDALWTRLDREETGARVSRFVRGPVFVLSGLVLALGGLALASGGFSGLRSFFQPLPYPRPQELVIISQERSMGHPHSVQQQSFALWTRESKTLQGLAGFTVAWRRIDSVNYEQRVARVTPNFFQLLGVKAQLGRVLRDGDGPGMAVVTDGFWRTNLGRDPKATGRRIVVAGEQAEVVGVLPPSFSLLSKAAAVMVPFDLSPSSSSYTVGGKQVRLVNPRSRHLIGAIARLKPGVTKADAEKELLALLKSANIRYSSALRLTALEDRRFTPLAGYAVGLGFAVAIGLVMIVVARPALAWMKHPTPAIRLRYWGFFFGKTVLLLTVLLLGWIEISHLFSTRAPDEFLRVIVGVAAVGLTFLISCGCALFWCFYDQQRRCPECLLRLTLPVRIGSWSSPLLEPVTTEMVCERGHGSLCVPETQSSASEKEKWTSLDSSWRELFTK